MIPPLALRVAAAVAFVLLQVIEALLRAAPEGAKTADVYGRLPLHYAVDKAAPDLEVVSCLLRAFPAGKLLYAFPVLVFDYFPE